MALGRRVQLLLEHALVDRADGPLRARRRRAPCMRSAVAEAVLGHRAADAARDPLGAVARPRRRPPPRATARRRRRRRPPSARPRSGSGRRPPACTPGIRRPVRMITLPSISSRRMRLGLPTSSAPSGVIVAALIPKPASRIAARGRRHDLVVRSCGGSRARGRSARARRSTRVTAGSSTRSACSSSSWPVSSPSRTIIRSAVRHRRGVQPELVRALLHRGDHEGHVLVEVDAELLGALRAPRRGSRRRRSSAA